MGKKDLCAWTHERIATVSHVPNMSSSDAFKQVLIRTKQLTRRFFYFYVILRLRLDTHRHARRGVNIWVVSRSQKAGGPVAQCSGTVLWKP